MLHCESKGKSRIRRDENKSVKKIEKVQLVLPPSRRPDTYIPKFAGWPQSLGILSAGTYIKQNNPGVEVEILDGNNVLTLNEMKSKIDADLVGISATAVGVVSAYEPAH